MKIYLDVCCLNRLFDDQRQPRVAVETAAVQRVLELAGRGLVTDYSSEMALVEIDRSTDRDRVRKVTSLLPPSERIISLNDSQLDFADELEAAGFSLADAVHLAAARELNIDVFLTVDDRLMRRATRIAKNVPFRVLNPVQFLQEMNDAIDG
jgi:predicted nucleic acid-binding protein